MKETMDKTGKEPASVVVNSPVSSTGRARMLTDKEMSPVGNENVELVWDSRNRHFILFSAIRHYLRLQITTNSSLKG